MWIKISAHELRWRFGAGLFLCLQFSSENCAWKGKWRPWTITYCTEIGFVICDFSQNTVWKHENSAKDNYNTWNDIFAAWQVSSIDSFKTNGLIRLLLLSREKVFKFSLIELILGKSLKMPFPFWALKIIKKTNIKNHHRFQLKLSLNSIYCSLLASFSFRTMFFIPFERYHSSISWS